MIRVMQIVVYVAIVVVRQPYDIRVEGNEVFMGNVAFLRCVLPEHVRKFVVVSAWFRDDEELLAEAADMGNAFLVWHLQFIRLTKCTLYDRIHFEIDDTIHVLLDNERFYH